MNVVDYMYIVSSPMQALNAIEASFAVDPNSNHSHHVVIAYSKNSINNNQMEKVVALREWSGKTALSIGNKLNYLNAARLIASDQLCNRHYERIYIGDYRVPFMHLLANNISCNYRFLLDDGAGTPLRQERDLSPGAMPKSYGTHSRIKDLYRSAVLVFYGLKSDYPKRDWNLYTVYKLAPHPFQKVEINNYYYLKSVYLSRFNIIKEGVAVYIIGSNLINAGIVTKDQYVEALAKALKACPRNNYLYIAHRREDENVVAEIASNYGLKYLYPDCMIELYFATNGIHPSEVIAFPSFATVVLQKIYPDIKIHQIVF